MEEKERKAAHGYYCLLKAVSRRKKNKNKNKTALRDKRASSRQWIEPRERRQDPLPVRQRKRVFETGARCQSRFYWRAKRRWILTAVTKNLSSRQVTVPLGIFFFLSSQRLYFFLLLTTAAGRLLFSLWPGGWAAAKESNLQTSRETYEPWTTPSGSLVYLLVIFLKGERILKVCYGQLKSS